MRPSEDDPMIAEIREYRDKQAARFGSDGAAIIRHARAMHEASGRPSVQYPSPSTGGNYCSRTNQ